MTNRVILGVWATTTGSGPFHPAFWAGGDTPVWVWPNMTFDTEEDAEAWAQRMLNDAEQAAEAVAQLWNVVEA